VIFFYILYLICSENTSSKRPVYFAAFQGILAAYLYHLVGSLTWHSQILYEQLAKGAFHLWL